MLRREPDDAQRLQPSVVIELLQAEEVARVRVLRKLNQLQVVRVITVA